jgi:RimJ/RimL family protein N-acetyltransferase
VEHPIDVELASARPRIRFVPLGEAHRAELGALVRDPRVRMPAGLPEPIPEGWAEALIHSRTRAREQGRSFTFAIEQDRPAGGLIGVCSVHRLRRSASSAEIAFFLSAAWWGRGIGRAAAEWLIEFSFRTLAVDRLVALCLPGNERARRVLVGCGFTRMATGPRRFPSSRRAAALTYWLER